MIVVRLGDQFRGLLFEIFFIHILFYSIFCMTLSLNKFMYSISILNAMA